MPPGRKEFPGIPFTVSQSLQNVRLLEVPDELLDIIVNSQQNLYFKSSVSPSDGKNGDVHLCTDDKVYAVKQVSTSNSVYVTQSSSLDQTEPRRSEDEVDEAMELDGVEGESTSSLAITAIAKPTSILELLALSPASYETTVLDNLNALVPTISSASEISTTRPMNKYSLKELYTHISAPTSIIQHVLALKCAFEMASSGPASSGIVDRDTQAYLPSPGLLVSTWTEIMEVATLTGKEISGVHDTTVLQEGTDSTIHTTEFDMEMDDEQRNNVVHKAISERLFQKDGYFASIGVIDKETGKLNDRECTRWVGNLILAVTATHQHDDVETTLTRDDFETQWENSVPASWIKYCSVEVLSPSCELTTVDGKDLVKWAPFTLEADTVSNGANGKNEGKLGAQSAAGTKNKRKWHEKFAAQRNAKK